MLLTYLKQDLNKGKRDSWFQNESSLLGLLQHIYFKIICSFKDKENCGEEWLAYISTKLTFVFEWSIDIPFKFKNKMIMMPTLIFPIY